MEKKQPKKQPTNKVRELVNELDNLYLRSGSEMRERGLYYRVLADISRLNGHVDKDTALVSRIKEIVTELKELV